MVDERPTTDDALFCGQIRITQPARGQGYRVNFDALLLAAFAARTLAGTLAPSPRPARAAFDLGAGVGSVGLSLLHLGAASHVTLVERDPWLASLAEINAERNEWSKRAAVQCLDICNAHLLPAGGADLVVCNPPYVQPGCGRIASGNRADARSGDLASFVGAARRLAGRRARICFVYPAQELASLLELLRGRGLEPKRMRMVHGRTGEPARVVLVECIVARQGGLCIEPSFDDATASLSAETTRAALEGARKDDPARSHMPNAHSSGSTRRGPQ